MGYKKVVLGLDVGVGSIGWGLVQLAEEKYTDEKADGTVEEKYKIADGKIIAAGVRGFQLPQDRQKKSLALIRGSARRSRKTIKRKTQRLKRLIALAKEFNLIGNDFNYDQYLKPHKGDKESAWDIWLIRKEALERKLTDVELFRVLYHIAKHRGFYFATKAEEIQEEEKGSESGKAKAGLARIRKKLEEGNWQTVGQMFWEEYKQTNPNNKRKRNAKDNYENSIHRTLLADEVRIIFECQRNFNNSKAQEELRLRYINDVLMFEEGHDDERLQKMMGRCEFTGEICAPRESYTAERFTLFNRLNVLEIKDAKTGGTFPLDGQRHKIEALAYKNSKVTFAQIRTELGLQNELHLRFNLCSYRENNPEYSKKLDCEIKNGQLQFNEKHKVPIVDIRSGEVTLLDEKVKEVFNSKKLWPKATKIHVYYSDIRKHLNISSNYRFSNLSGYTKSVEEFGSEAKYIKQFENESFIELSGYHKIKNAIEKYSGSETWRQLNNDTATLDTIAEALTYCKSDETRTAYLKERHITDQGIIDAALTLNMDKLANFSKTALTNLLNYMGYGPVMLFHEAKEKCGYGKTDYQKQPILEPYTGFFEKNPVVARVIAQTRKVVNAIIRKYSGAYPIDQIHIEVATELANSKKRKAEIAQGQARYREDKQRAEERCREKGLNPDEGQTLLMFRLAEQQNNRCPYTKTPISFEPPGSPHEIYIMDCEIDHIIPMSRSFNDSMNNKVLCKQKANQEKRDRIPFEWFEETYGKNSQEWADYENWVKKLYSMPYPKRLNLLRKSWTEQDKEKFISRNLNDTRYAARHIADYLRKYFDFSKSQREDIKDVSRIQLRSGGVTAFLRHIWGLNKNREENDLHHALDALVVACSTYGHVYLVSNLSKEIERKGKNWYKHFGRDKFKPGSNIREDIDKIVSDIFVSRMPRHKATAPAHKDTVSSLKNAEVKNRILKINGGYAEMDEIIRADVFTDKSGKNYVVPIYAVDIFSKKPLPDKYVPDDVKLPYDKWPSINDKELTFKFSLFKDDLISINDKMYYVSFFEAATNNVNVKNIDGSIFPDKKDAQDPYTKKICYRPKSRTRKCILKKYYI
jgi:CRISPR-associated endonuclease Csn1